MKPISQHSLLNGHTDRLDRVTWGQYNGARVPVLDVEVVKVMEVVEET